MGARRYVIVVLAAAVAAAAAPAVSQDDVCGDAQAEFLGTAGPDHIVGTSGIDNVQARGGDDTVEGLEGSDALCGGDGDDVVHGGDGEDTVFAQDGDDTVLAGDGRDLVDGGLGADVEDVRSGKGDDRLVGNGASNRLHGAAGDDRLIGELGSDLLDGGDGDDSLTARDGVQDALVDCGPGADDFATVDLKDTAFATGNRVFGCETVFSGAIDEEPNQAIARRARRAGGAVLVRIRCPRGLADACAGRLRLRSADGRRKLAGAPYDVPSGSARTVRVAVGGRARRLRAVAVEPGLHGPKTTVQALRVRG